MNITIEEKDNEIIAYINDSWTFRDYEEYTKIINKIKTISNKKFVIDLDKCDFIDSSGLGMLVIANDEMIARDIKPVIRNVCGRLKDLFYAARFDKLYKFE